MRRLIALGLLISLLSTVSFCKNKKKQGLPDIVLNAKTVYVRIDPDAGASVTNPNEQNAAVENVEQALRAWGRFRVLSFSSAEEPDLVIEIRKGGGARTTLHGGPINQRPGVTIGDIGNVHLGSGAPPTDTGSPTMQSGYSTDQDSFVVYFGSESKAPLWRYSGKGSLDSAQPRAVTEFKKAITDAEEAKKQNNP